MSLVKDLVNGIIWGWSKKMTAKDEDSEIHKYVRKFNFLGVDVIAKVNPIDVTQVDVFIPGVPYPSYYNTGDCIVPDFGTVGRHVSSPTVEGVPFGVYTWLSGEVVPCSRDNNVSFDTPTPCRFENDASTTIETNIYDADGISIIATHTSSGIVGDMIATVNNITIAVSNWLVVGPVFSADVDVSFNIAAVSPAGGRFSTEIIHHQGIDYIKSQGPIMHDAEPDVQTISSVTIAENTVSSTKYLSGIQYYDKGDTFDIGIGDIDYLNSDTYPTNFVQVLSIGEYGIGNFNLQGSDLTAWSTAHDDINSSHSSTKAINASNFRYVGLAANISARVTDWTPGASANSADAIICIDTWDQQSDELSEYFTDEAFRRTSTDIVWDSIQDMTAYDDNLGMLVQNGLLQTRHTDWNIYHPGLLANPNYAGFVGWGTYYRRFIDTATLVRGSCTMSIQGFTLTDVVNSDVRMWIFIPGRFASWCYVHGAATYDFGTFNGDNDPIRVLSSTANSIDITFGYLGLIPGNNYFIMWLEITNPAIRPDSIVVSW